MDINNTFEGEFHDSVAQVFADDIERGSYVRSLVDDPGFAVDKIADLPNSED